MLLNKKMKGDFYKRMMKAKMVKAKTMKHHGCKKKTRMCACKKSL